MDLSLYVLHSTINSRTYKRFRFRNYFRLSFYEFYIHQNLLSSGPERIDACLLGICEVISGEAEGGVHSSHAAEKELLKEGCRVEIPPDTGLTGECVVAFDFTERKVYLGSILTANKMFTFVSAF